jgi:hypothetical protein
MILIMSRVSYTKRLPLSVESPQMYIYALFVMKEKNKELGKVLQISSIMLRRPIKITGMFITSKLKECKEGFVSHFKSSKTDLQ